jgi:Tfp pilus assembly protein PilF
VDFGYLFLQRGDFQRARECFERALQLEPGHSKALRGTRELKLTQNLNS